MPCALQYALIELGVRPHPGPAGPVISDPLSSPCIAGRQVAARGRPLSSSPRPVGRGTSNVT